MSKRYQGGVLGVGFNPLQAPNAPTIGAATAGNTTVSVAFTAPANVGGSAISSYAVRVSPGNVSATGSSSPISVTGLTNDTTYTFSVAALNSYGPSPYSGTVTATPSFLAVEDVFSTYVYTGTGAGFTGSEQTIQNGINISGQGGMVWIKARVSTSGVSAFYNRHQIYDTQRGFSNLISSNTTDAQVDTSTAVQPLTNGFILASGGSYYGANFNGLNYVSWTFREAPKFFDVVTYTGNGVNGRQIAHNLGVTPGCIIYKCTSTAAQWLVLHRSLPNGFSDYLTLETTDAASSLGASFAPTSTTFTMSNGVIWNQNGQTYVAYLFAHDTTSDGIIQCGSFTTNGSGQATVNLGWEPQWTLIKASSTTSQWQTRDVMRGMSMTGSNILYPNLANAEDATTSEVQPTATGFFVTGNGHPANQTFIYIAIRRGPMKTPTSGTSVFAPTVTSASAGTAITVGFTTDLHLANLRVGDSNNTLSIDRLRSISSTSGSSTGVNTLTTSSTRAEATNAANIVTGFNNTGWVQGSYAAGFDVVHYDFRRAPSFFDEVCYTGIASTRTINHNLGVVPELIIVKNRTSGGTAWPVWTSTFSGTNDSVYLNTTAAKSATGLFTTTPPTSTVFTVGNDSWINDAGYNYVAYLFASCPGVSKVGSYTGTGTTQTINCGFTTGARFVLIKRTDSTGDWYVWDSARGIVAGNDPYLLLNSTAAEVTNTDYVDTDNSGFQISSTAPAAINANGGSFIYLAIS